MTSPKGIRSRVHPRPQNDVIEKGRKKPTEESPDRDETHGKDPEIYAGKHVRAVCLGSHYNVTLHSSYKKRINFPLINFQTIQN